MFGEPEAWRALMEKLAEVVRRYLRAQIDGRAPTPCSSSTRGSATLAPADYREYVQPHVRHILAGRREDAACPSSTSARTRPRCSRRMRDAGGTVIGVDWRTPLDEAWARIGYDRAVQGNLDPLRCSSRRARSPSRHAQRVLDAAGGRPGHIFNLGHGILPGDARSTTCRPSSTTSTQASAR